MIWDSSEENILHIYAYLSEGKKNEKRKKIIT